MNGGNDFNGKYFKLGNDITYNTNGVGATGENFTPIGGWVTSYGDRDFSGTFDGQGHTISGIRLYKDPDNSSNSCKNQGLFGRISNTATVKNVILTNARITGYRIIAGIVGNNGGGRVENCLVLNSSITSGDTYVGAIIGKNSSGSILTTNHYHGCTVNGTTNATNVGVGGNGVGISYSNDKTGARSVHTITLPEGITATGESVTTGGTTYYASTATITLAPPIGYSAVFCYNDGTDHALSGNTFTMPAKDVTVSATLTVLPWEGIGTEGSPYVITNSEQLDALATAVKGGETYNGTYFVLGNDITYSTADLGDTDENFTTIGGFFDGSDKNFCGIFDGKGYTISGIRLCKPQTNQNVNKNQALFGRTVGATIKNVTLADARITGYRIVAGIVGNCESSTVENCLVLNSSITCKDTYVGAIIGKNNSGNTFTNNYYHGCTVNDTANATNVGIGDNGGINSSKDVTDNNGARSVYAITLDTDITATPTATVSFNDVNYYTENTEITLTYTGDIPEGYFLDGFTVTKNSGDTVSVTESGDAYTFTMPAEDVTVCATLAEKPAIVGDVNGDGTVNISDVIMVVNIILGNDIEYDLAKADVNGDDTVNISDAILVVNIILGNN